MKHEGKTPDTSSLVCLPSLLCVKFGLTSISEKLLGRKCELLLQYCIAVLAVACAVLSKSQPHRVQGVVLSMELSLALPTSTLGESIGKGLGRK
eukprot:856918-Amphidinium_carterae.1